MKNIREELKKVELVHERHHCANSSYDRYYLDLTYEREDESGVYELRIPRVYLPILRNSLPVVESEIVCRELKPSYTINLGFGELSLSEFTDENGYEYYAKETCIKEKTHKMTVAEIEKKLGYKIEIVSDK